MRGGAAWPRPIAAQMVARSLHYLGPYRGRGLVVVLTILVDTAFTIALYYGLKVLIDAATSADNRRAVVPLLAALGILYVITTLGNVIREHAEAGLEVALADDLRVAMLTHLQTLPPSYYERVRTGELLTRFASDVGAIKGGLTRGFPTIVRYGLQAAAVVILLFLFEWRLAALVVLLFAGTLALSQVVAVRSHRVAGEHGYDDARVMSVVQEMLLGQRMIRVFGSGRRLLDEVRAEAQATAPGRAHAAALSRLITRALESGVTLIQLTVAGAGAYLIFAHAMSIGSLVAFIGLLGVLGASIVRIALALPLWLDSRVAMGRVDALLAEPTAVGDAPGAVLLPRLAREIRCEDVGFAYPGQPFALRHVTLTIPAGHSVAVVGRNGSGKSTLLALLLRLWDPQEGTIRIDGRDIRTATLTSLHAQFGVVFQETFLLNRSARENIALGNPDATDAEIAAAARLAQIHDVIAALPHGYDTVVGERGVRLSGGQQQRLALARALVRWPAVLILDEATAALDPVTEAGFTQTLRHLPHGQTVIAVTHRLAAAVTADHIIVFDGGRVVEQGTHDELLVHDGYYRALWEKQTGFMIADAGRRATVTPRRLRAIPLFGAVDDANLVALADRFTSRRYEADEVIVREGEPGDAFYLIARGSVDVVTLRAGEDVHLATLEDGDYFGEIALLRDVPRTATVRAKAPTLVLVLARAGFKALLAHEPALRAAIDRVAAARVQDTVARE